MTDLDKFHNRQSKLFLFFALSFAVWQTSTLLVDVSDATGTLQHVLIGTMIISGFVWFAVFILLFGGLFSRKSNPAQDEWQAHISVNTMMFSYLAIISLIGVGVLWTIVIGPLEGEIVLRSLLIVSVVIPLTLNWALDKYMGGSVDD